MSYFSISKKYFKIAQIIFLLSCLISFINCEGSYTAESMEVVPAAGVGGGTLAVMIFIVVGIIIMILGLAFPNPGIFILVGILLPLLVFVICAFSPRKDISDEEKSNENHHKNPYIISRSLYFGFMGLFFLGLLGPAFMKWSINIMPQKIDSSPQDDSYDEKYLNELIKQKNRKYQTEETETLLPINRRRNNYLKNETNLNNNSLIQNTQNNISNNLIDNSNQEKNNEDQLPVLPRYNNNKNDFKENKRKFKRFKRDSSNP